MSVRGWRSLRAVGLRLCWLLALAAARAQRFTTEGEPIQEPIEIASSSYGPYLAMNAAGA